MQYTKTGCVGGLISLRRIWPISNLYYNLRSFIEANNQHEQQYGGSDLAASVPPLTQGGFIHHPWKGVPPQCLFCAFLRQTIIINWLWWHVRTLLYGITFVELCQTTPVLLLLQVQINVWMRFDVRSTGFLSEMGTKLRESAVGQAGGSCYSQAAVSSNDSKTRYIILPP